MTREDAEQYDARLAEARAVLKQVEIALAEVRMLEVDIHGLVAKDREIAGELARAFEAVPRAFEAVRDAFVEALRRE